MVSAMNRKTKKTETMNRSNGLRSMDEAIVRDSITQLQ